MKFSWEVAIERLKHRVKSEEAKPPLPSGMKEEQDVEGRYRRLDAGQCASLRWIAKRLQHHGIVLADEVGTGKTRIACAVVQAVVESGGRAAVVVPHGLMHQWVDEAWKLDSSGPEPKTLTTLTELLREQPGEDLWNQRKPYPDHPEWWLISHRFRAPLVYVNAEDWRAALPGLVELKLARPADRSDKRTRFGQLQKLLDEAPDSWWGKQARIAQDVAARLRTLPEFRKDIKTRIKRLPPLSGTSADANRPLPPPSEMVEMGAR